MSLKTQIETRIGEVLNRFPNLNRDQMTVAFSGGKDSLVLARSLQKLGKKVRLRAVDMGYSADWPRRIRELAAVMKLKVDVIPVRDLIQSHSTDSAALQDLADRRKFLDTLSHVSAPNITPCTNCYNCKVIALTQFEGSEGEMIFFAHHKTDLISSFLKTCVMYFDRWEQGNQVFARENYMAVLRNVEIDLKSTDSHFRDSFLDYLQKGYANTEEPAYEPKSLYGVRFAIGRPLLLCDEAETRAYANELGVRFESSGCGHTATAVTRTPRELVQFDLLPSVLRSRIGTNNIRVLEDAVIRNLNADGSLRVNTRASRRELLGPAYKGHEAERKY
jgi:tRNA(Ile)-lysidine synthase TilS/MesJ